MLSPLFEIETNNKMPGQLVDAIISKLRSGTTEDGELGLTEFLAWLDDKPSITTIEEK